MTQSPYINEGDQSNFQTLVIDRSAEVPVLVDFWAESCSPCKSLMPMLAQLSSPNVTVDRGKEVGKKAFLPLSIDFIVL
ncbi:MAG: thioredoxin domain-containing protein [Arenicellales bacterium]|jgi:thioredoxin-like negative regulator of GroEL|nr:thioredoxin domain-containing protein [Arenicellales bacterium]MDP7481424.1 thioredoxin domain-containing protein [Arenicellales bacterium]|tara:strand:+ start:57 stop:293 length:237 start_codon:yes stop_codon:yes gene_type:complete